MLNMLLHLVVCSFSPGLNPTVAARFKLNTVLRTGPFLSTSDLPQGWKEVTEGDSGKTYYYNVATGVTQSEKPTVGRRSLTSSCTWRVKLDLTAPGTTSSATITANLRFSEEDGYE